MKKNKKIILISTFIIIILITLEFVDYYKFQSLAPDPIEDILKKNMNNNLGIIYYSEVRYKEISKDSMMYKLMVKTSINKIVGDGIVYKKGDLWNYLNVKNTIFDKDKNIESNIKYYSDGSLVDW